MFLTKSNAAPVRRRFWTAFFSVAVLAATTIFSAVGNAFEVVKTTPTDAVPSAAPKLYVLTVGSNLLEECCNDAKIMADAFRDRGAKAFGAENVVVKTLTEKDVTRENLESAIGEIATRAEPQDVFFFFFSTYRVSRTKTAGRAFVFRIARTNPKTCRNSSTAKNLALGLIRRKRSAASRFSTPVVPRQC